MRLLGAMLVLTAVTLITHGDALLESTLSTQHSLISNKASENKQRLRTEVPRGFKIRLQEAFSKVKKIRRIMQEALLWATTDLVEKDVKARFKSWFDAIPDPDKEFHIASIWGRMQHDGDIHLFKSLFDAIGIDEQKLKAFTDKIRDVPVKPVEAT